MSSERSWIFFLYVPCLDSSIFACKMLCVFVCVNVIAYLDVKFVGVIVIAYLHVKSCVYLWV